MVHTTGNANNSGQRRTYVVALFAYINELLVVLPIELKCGLTEKNKKKYCSVPLKNVLSHSELMRGAFHTIRKMNVMSGSAFRCILTTSYPFIRYFNSEMSHRSMNAMTPQG